MQEKNEMIEALVNPPEQAQYKSLPSEFLKHRFDQYQLYVELMDRSSQRRNQANGFFLTLHTAVIVATTLPWGQEVSDSNFSFVHQLPALIAGIILCIVWITLSNRYKKLSEAKFQVIEAMETQLPFNMFVKAEWEEALMKKKTGKAFPGLTNVEQWVPKIFILLYLAELSLSIISNI